MSELSLTIKCSNADKATVAIESTATVLELKEKIAGVLSAPVAQQRLIYKGRVLKDDLTLESYEIQTEHTVHLVKGAPPAGSTPPNNDTVRPMSSTPVSTIPNGSSDPLASIFSQVFLRFAPSNTIV
jgi:ubiquilin